MFFSFLYFLATLYIYICSFTTLKYYFYYMLNSHFFCTVLFTSLCNHTVVINKAFYSMMAFDTVISIHCLLSLFFFVIILCFVLWLLLLISFPRDFTVSNNAFGASLIAQSLKSLPAVQETWVRSQGWEDPLEKEMTTHSSIIAWKISWTEEPGELQSMGSQRVGHDWATNTN